MAIAKRNRRGMAVLALLALLASAGVWRYKGNPVRACRVITVHSAEGDFQYWVSPLITNGNGQTHICANLFQADSGKWALELPRKGRTLEILTLDRPAAVELIEDNCRVGL